MNRLKLRQLELLVQLAEHHSLARAAGAMSVTQPAATKLLQETEQILGVALFERLPRGMRATPCGEIMMRHARTALAALDRGREEIAALIEGASGAVAVGSVRAATSSLLAPALAAVRTSRPSLRVSVLVDAAEILIPRLREARLDIVLGHVPASLGGRDLAFEPMLEETLVTVSRAGHPLSRKKRLAWKDVARSEWIVYPQETPLRALFEGMLSGVIETASVVATTMMLERTDMLAVMPRDVAEHYASRGLVEILKLKLPVTLGRIGIVTHKDRQLSPAANAFIGEVRRLASTPAAPRGARHR